MMQPTRSDYAQVQAWRRLYVAYLWLSVATCVLAAVFALQIGEGENSKLLAAGLFGLGMIAVAFARAFASLNRPRWWHWVLGTAAIMPAAVVALLIGAPTGFHR